MMYFVICQLSFLLMILYHRLIKELYTFNEFLDTYMYNVNINFVECYGISSALSNNWNQIIMGETIKLVNKIVLNIEAENKSCEYFLQNLFVGFDKLIRNTS